MKRFRSYRSLLLGIGLTFFFSAFAQNPTQSPWGVHNEADKHTKFRTSFVDLYRVNVDGTGEKALTTSPAQDDGPEYTADGKWIYFCSNRGGKWWIWRMPADGGGTDDRMTEEVASTADQDWFPHVSPDGRWLYAIAYPPDLEGHLYIGPDAKINLWQLPEGPGGKATKLQTISTFYGGQGAGNTTGWSADSKLFVWSVYEKLPQDSVR